MKDLIKKLKIKHDHRVAIINADQQFINAFKNDFEGLLRTSLKDQYDVVLVFVKNSLDLNLYFLKAKNFLSLKGTLWVAYPKQSSGVSSDLTRDKGWETVSSKGWSGVSLVSIDKTWSALRLKPNEQIKKALAPVVEIKDRVIIVPDDFQKALDKNKEAMEIFSKFAYTHRKEYVRWIEEAKKAETRERRIKQAIERIAEGVKFS